MVLDDKLGASDFYTEEKLLLSSSYFDTRRQPLTCPAGYVAPANRTTVRNLYDVAVDWSEGGLISIHIVVIDETGRVIANKISERQVRYLLG
jgi:hypothetical protein